MIEAVTGNSEIVSNKFHQGLLKLKELWDYAAKKEISLSRKKNVAVGLTDVQLFFHYGPTSN